MVRIGKHMKADERTGVHLQGGDGACCSNNGIYDIVWHAGMPARANDVHLELLASAHDGARSRANGACNIHKYKVGLLAARANTGSICHTYCQGPDDEGMAARVQSQAHA